MNADPSAEIATLRERLSPLRRRCVECGRNRRIALVHQVDGDWLCLPGDCATEIAHAETIQIAARHEADIHRPGLPRLAHFQRLADAFREHILSGAVDALVAEVRSLSEALQDCQRDLIAVHAAVPRWAEGKTLGERVQHVASRAARTR